MREDDTVLGVVCCGLLGLFFSLGAFFFDELWSERLMGAFAGIFFIGLAACLIATLLRDRTHLKKEEFSGIVSKCRQHPDKDIEDMVREAVQGARHWTFKTAWKKLRDSHDYGRIFTGIFR